MILFGHGTRSIDLSEFPLVRNANVYITISHLASSQLNFWTPIVDHRSHLFPFTHKLSKFKSHLDFDWNWIFFIEIGWIVHRNAKNISSRVVNNHWLLLLLVHCQYLYGYGIRQTAYKTGHTHSGRIKSNKIWNVGWNWIRVVIMRIINERNLCIHTKRLEFREPVLINNFLFLCYFLHLCGSIAIMLTEWNICDWNEKTLKTNHTQIKHRIRKNKSQSDFQFSLNVIGQSCKDLAVGQIRLWIVQSEKKRWKARL